ncbi:MAG: penicillin-binding protein 2 [Alphaproteobacteria bacterium]|nr:penicillin-binding protein 2 [Alphaproteobacteria bacterium]
MKSADLHIEGAKSGAMEMARTRLVVPVSLFILGFSLLIVRLISIGILDDMSDQVTRVPSGKVDIIRERVDILDRNGTVMATNLPAPSLAVRPNLITNPEETADRIVAVLPDLNRIRVLNKLRSSRRFLYIKRNLSPTQVWKINALGYPGLILERAEKRVYPQGRLASHVLGYVDMDGKPQAGVEKFFDDHLSNPERSNDPLYLSIDLRVQYIMREDLVRTMARFSARAAAGIVMNVNTGEVLAMVSLPDFDGNAPIHPGSPEMKNRNIVEPYEMGSEFKTFTVAMALDSGVVKLGDEFDATKPLKVGRQTIHDDHAKNRFLDVPEIYTFSSNIGASRIIRKVGVDIQKKYLARFGLFNKPVIELTGLSRPILPQHWGEIQSMTVSYGQGIAVTPLNMVTAIASVVNGGRLIPATLIRQNKTENTPSYGLSAAPPVYPRVISAQTSRKMRQLMRLAVDEGTGGFARVAGYRVGGKTGTAEKVVDGVYHPKRKITSFVGVFPMDKPQYIVFAMFDEPHGIKATFNMATGGWVAAPVVGDVIRRIGPILGVMPVLNVKTQYRNLIFIGNEKK